MKYFDQLSCVSRDSTNLSLGILQTVTLSSFLWNRSSKVESTLHPGFLLSAQFSISA
jgi:hypothetical protein